MRRLAAAFFVVAVVVAGFTGVVVSPSSAVECTRTFRIDPPPPVREGNPLVFTVTLVTQPGCPVIGTVRYHTEVPVVGGGFDATPGTSVTSPKADYLTKSGTLQWVPGDQPTKPIPVQTLVDNLDEVPEQVAVCLDSATLASSCAVGELGSPMCMQADTTVLFAIGLPLPARDTVDVFYNTIDGTAREGEDYVGVHNGHVQIPRGQLDTIAPVRILPNRPGEGFEFFYVEFRSTHDGYVETSRVKVDIMTAR